MRPTSKTYVCCNSACLAAGNTLQMLLTKVRQRVIAASGAACIKLMQAGESDTLCMSKQEVLKNIKEVKPRRIQD